MTTKKTKTEVTSIVLADKDEMHAARAVQSAATEKTEANQNIKRLDHLIKFNLPKVPQINDVPAVNGYQVIAGDTGEVLFKGSAQRRMVSLPDEAALELVLQESLQDYLTEAAVDDVIWALKESRLMGAITLSKMGVDKAAPCVQAAYRDNVEESWAARSIKGG